MIFGKKGKKKSESVEDLLLPYLDKLQEQKDILIGLGDEIRKITKDLPAETEDDLGGKLKNRSLDAMSFLNTTTHIMVGYDTEILAMLSMVKDEYREFCYRAIHTYMTNTKNMLVKGLPYLVVVGETIEIADLKKVLEGFFQAYKRTMSLYDECLDILKSATGD